MTDARSWSADAQEAIRKSAVTEVLGGRSRTEVAHLFGVTRQTVTRWVKIYERDGAGALANRPRGRPKGVGSRLEPGQKALVAKTLRDRMPDQLKLPSYLWTREALVDLVERRFGVRISKWTAGRYLKEWGFTHGEPVRRAHERRGEALRRWLDEEYPVIRTRARRERARIYWGHEVGQGFDCSTVSAMTNRGKLSFMVFKGRFTADVFIEFLRRLLSPSPGKVFLIVDGHPTHRARKVEAWVQDRAEEIELVYLPQPPPIPPLSPRAPPARLPWVPRSPPGGER